MRFTFAMNKYIIIREFPRATTYPKRDFTLSRQKKQKRIREKEKESERKLFSLRKISRIFSTRKTSYFISVTWTYECMDTYSMTNLGILFDEGDEKTQFAKVLIFCELLRHFFYSIVIGIWIISPIALTRSNE